MGRRTQGPPPPPAPRLPAGNASPAGPPRPSLRWEPELVPDAHPDGLEPPRCGLPETMRVISVVVASAAIVAVACLLSRG